MCHRHLSGCGEVPSVLVLLGAVYLSSGGLSTEGSFRVAPDKSAVAAFRCVIVLTRYCAHGSHWLCCFRRCCAHGSHWLCCLRRCLPCSEALHRGVLQVGVTSHVAAALIKIWFRECSPCVLDSLSEAELSMSTTVSLLHAHPIIVLHKQCFSHSCREPCMAFLS